LIDNRPRGLRAIRASDVLGNGNATEIAAGDDGWDLRQSVDAQRLANSRLHISEKFSDAQFSTTGGTRIFKADHLTNGWIELNGRIEYRSGGDASLVAGKIGLTARADVCSGGGQCGIVTRTSSTQAVQPRSNW